MNRIKSKSIAPTALSAFLTQGNACELLDVRLSPEYANAHVPGATLIPLHRLKVEEFIVRHEPGTPIFVLCQTGSRAAKAIEQFELAGCDDCVLVEGGTQAWIDVGLPVHRGARNALPLTRQVQLVVGSLSAVGAVLALAVNSWFAVLPLVLGCGLVFAGITGTCGLALLLAKMPWNLGQNSCTHCCIPE